MTLHCLIVGRREDVDKEIASETSLYVLQDGPIIHNLVSMTAILMMPEVLHRSSKMGSMRGELECCNKW